VVDKLGLLRSFAKLRMTPHLRGGVPCGDEVKAFGMVDYLPQPTFPDPFTTFRMTVWGWFCTTTFIRYKRFRMVGLSVEVF
jgi:hypothetical protein